MRACLIGGDGLGGGLDGDPLTRDLTRHLFHHSLSCSGFSPAGLNLHYWDISSFENFYLLPPLGAG